MIPGGGNTRARAAMTAGLAALEVERKAGGDRAQQLRAYDDALEVGRVPRLDALPLPSGMPCQRRGCYCTHSAPCQAGWMPSEEIHVRGRTYEQAMPCPQCRPDAYTRYVVRLEATSTVRN